MYKKFILICKLATIAIISASVNTPLIAMESISNQELENIKSTISKCQTYRNLRLTETKDPYPLISLYEDRKPTGHEVSSGQGVAYLTGYNWDECHWEGYSAVSEKYATNTELASYIACKTCVNLIKFLKRRSEEPNCIIL